MKKYFKNKTVVALLLAAGLTLSSCSRDYLETEPTTSIDYTSAITNLENLTTVLNGMHRNMYVRQNSSQGQNGGTAVLIYMDVMGDDLIFPSTGNGWFVSTLRWLDNNNASSGNVFYPYRFYYGQIANANIIINNADKVEVAGSDIAKRDRVLGEAYAFRAYAYSMLVQIYGKRYVPGSTNSQLGVPLRLDESRNPIPRATVEEVYASINSDLEKASSLLNGKARANKSHFDYKVVRGLMARVALTQGRYADAATFANQARQGYTLMDNETYKKGFNNYEVGEWMWGYHIIEEQSDYFGNFMAYMSRNYNSTQIRSAPKVVNKNLYNMFPASDVRTQVIDPTGQHTALALPSNYAKFPYTSQKFLSVSNDKSLGDIPFMRAAEMYLIEAEALARTGQEAASKAVFTILEKNRNPEYTTTTATGAAYIEQIMNSRRLELWGEGFRWLDLKRLALPLDRTGANFVGSVINNLYTVSPTDKRWTWLIPQDEINNSGGVVVQNEL